MLPVQRHTLDNGLQVLFCPFRYTSTASAWIFYRVGSRNESPGQTGLSHWVEHMTYKGAGRFGKGQIAREISRRGGIWNGFTYYDWTAYFETLPAAGLGLALEIERERMQQVSFEPAEVEAERTVILSEREGAENEPSFLLQEEVNALALRVHPYRQPIIGWKEDLRRLSTEDLVQHYRRYYVPNNALLVLAGAFDPQEALGLVGEALGRIPPGHIPSTPRAVEPPQQGERRVVLRRPGPTAILVLAVPAPAAGEANWLPLLLLEALLGGAKGLGIFRRGPALHRSSRLYRALVETELAVAVSCQAPFTLDPGLFTIQVTLRAGRSPEEIEPVLFEELARIAEVAPSEEELARAARQLRAQIAYGSESPTALAGWLGMMEIVGRPEPPEAFLEALGRVRPEDVRRVAAACFAPERRTIGWFVPRGEGGAPSQHIAIPAVVSRAGAPREAAGRNLAPRAEEIVRRVLPGGAVLLVRENPVHPVVAVQGYLRGGSLLDPPGREGLCALTAQMLLRGTRHRGFRELHEELEGVGAGIEFSAGPHAISFAAKALAQDVQLLLERLVEMLREPAFEETEWRRRKGEVLTQLRQLADDPDYVADRAFRETLFPEGHPYGRRPEGTVESVGAIERADLEAFHQACVSPGGLVIAVCGAVQAEAVEQMLERA
ncbi:MAG: M16 family metallopeptidase, partial [Chloroflexia bacterium]